MQTQAAVSREGAPHPRIEEIELGPPQAGELLVRVVACGVCHTDLTVHERPGPRPMVLGHEGAGIVEETGPGVTGFAPGDHVVMSAAAHCGLCAACRDGAPPYCVEGFARNFGGQIWTGKNSDGVARKNLVQHLGHAQTCAVLDSLRPA